MTDGRHYVRTGDRFTRLVQDGSGPPTVRIRRHAETGRQYYTRVKVEDCRAVTLQQLTRLVGGAALLRCMVTTHALEWQPTNGETSLVPLRQNAFHMIGLTTSPSGRGVRVWLSCPRCGQCCGVVYASRWGNRGEQSSSLVIGCRVCLGLTDASRQQHKTFQWSRAVLGEQPHSQERMYQVRSEHTSIRAQQQCDRVSRSLAAALRGLSPWGF
jgi:hypothetical protein